MKFEVERDVFVAALSTAKGVCAKEANMPILRCVLLKSEGGRVEVMATDLELSVRLGMEAVVLSEGAAGIPAKEALDLVRGLSESRVVVEATGNQVLIQAGRSKRKLPTVSGQDYPLIPKAEIDFLPCEKSALRRAIEKASYCMPPEGDAFSIAGLFVEKTGTGRYRFVSCDGHRLVYQEVPSAAMADVDVARGIVIPAKGVQEMSKLLEKEGEASIGLEPNHLLIRTPMATLRMQLLEAEFPEYEMIIPEDRPHAVVLDARAVEKSLKSMSVLASSKFQAASIHLSQGTITIRARGEDLAEAEDQLEIDYSGEDFTVHYNLKYLSQMLSSMAGEKARLEWVDNLHGGIFLEPEDPGALHLVMPMVL